MKNAVCVLSLMILPQIQYAQHVNLVIEVNEKLVNEQIQNMYLLVSKGPDKISVPVDYVPGEMTLNDDTWKMLSMDTTVKLSLHFNYSTLFKGELQGAHFFVDLAFEELKKRYLILNIYDFRDKKYKHWYQWHTDKDFLAELWYPGRGLYIRRR